MELRFRQEYQNGDTRRTATVTTAKNKEPVEIFFIVKGEELPPPQVLDGFVIGVIFYAMRLGEDLHVHGAVSAELLANMRELQEAWTLWRPNRYKKIAVSAEQVVDTERPRPPKALAAFSGGVDSVFTLLRHAKNLRGTGFYPLDDALVLIDGFDIPLSSPHRLEALKARIAPLATELGFKIKVVRTNLKELMLQEWEDTFIPQLAACLHNFSHAYAYALVGSSEPYDTLVTPWGSNPTTDPLLSGGAMRVIHDGAGYSRTEKVALIAKHPTATRVLKVCWEGYDTSKNCGVCEKCVRTQLNFLAAGEAAPACFDKPLELKAIAAIPLRNKIVCGELKTIAAYAKRRGIKAPWLDALEQRIKAYRPSTRLTRLKPKLKKLAKAVMHGDLALIKGKIKKELAAKRRG